MPHKSTEERPGATGSASLVGPVNALKHGLFYSSLYVGTGVSMPYVPVWFASVGLTAAQIGVILSAPMIGRLFAGPLLAILADRFQLRRTPMFLYALAGVVSFALLMVVKGFWWWLILWFIGYSAIAAISPLADVLSMKRGRELGFAYAVPRGIGSVAFILANVIGGRVMAVAQPVISVIWSAVAAASAAVGALTLLPRTPVRAEGEPVHAEESPFAAITSLIRNPALLLVFLTASLVQGGHAMVYGFSTLDWTHQGHSSALVGLLWGISVAAEVIFFWFGEGFRRRMGGAGLLLLGAVAGVIRWTALALSPPVWLLFPIQCLHAFSFCASFTGTLELVDRLSPRQHVSAAQMLAASVSFGFSTGVATIACGWLYGQFGAHAYLAMAAMALAAVVCAIRLVRVAPAHAQSAL